MMLLDGLLRLLISFGVHLHHLELVLNIPPGRAGPG